MIADSIAVRQVLRLAVVLLAGAFLLTANAQAEPDQSTWHVYFSPNHGATKAVVDVLTAARRTILVQAYSFTSAPIAKALADAHARGVDVQVILDRLRRAVHRRALDIRGHRDEAQKGEEEVAHQVDATGERHNSWFAGNDA